MDERRGRQAKNEMLFRSINERIEELGEKWLSTDTGARAYDFVCECQSIECTEPVALTSTEYEAVRESGRQFIVAPSAAHVDTSIENVVDMSSARYWVVEKIEESGELAEDEDPRT